MSKSKKVWVADDDESIRFVLEKGLINSSAAPADPDLIACS